jgi:hypothetical protein
MQTNLQNQPWTADFGTNHTLSRRALWSGRVLGVLGAGMLVLDSVGKLLQVDAVVTTTEALEYSPTLVFPLGIILLGCVLVYLLPLTSIVGAVLLTGYLGAATATHVRVGSPLLTHILFPAYVGALLWGSLLLRDHPRLRELAPWSDRSRS